MVRTDQYESLMLFSLSSSIAKRTPFYYGWVVAGGIGVISFSSVTFMPSPLGVFFEGMTAEFGWSRGQLSGAIFMGSLLVVVIGPLAGRAVDLFGARIVLTTACAVMALALVVLSRADSLWIYYVALSLGSAATTGVIRIATSAAIARWFIRRRGMAASFVSAGSALGFIVIPVVAAFVIDEWGWRAGWLSFALIMAFLGLPASFLLLAKEPEDVGQDIDDETGRDNRLGEAEIGTREEQWTASEALRTATFWTLLLAMTVMGISSGGVSVHLVPQLLERGVSSTYAALTISIFGFVMLPSTILWGLLLDRLSARAVYIMASAIVGFYAIGALLANANWMVIPLGIIMGVGFGGTSVAVRVIFANYFGRLSVGTVQGIATPFLVIGSGFGVLIAGLMFDATGTYSLVFSIFAGLGIVGIILILMVPAPRRKSKAGADANQDSATNVSA